MGREPGLERRGCLNRSDQAVGRGIRRQVRGQGEKDIWISRFKASDSEDSILDDSGSRDRF